MPEVSTRPATTVDAESLAPLHLRVWEEAYRDLIPAAVLAERSASPLGPRIERWRERIARHAVHVAHGGDHLVGWCEVGQGRDADDAGLELMSLYVVSAVYGLGVGHRLLETALGAKSAYLWVLDGNARAIAFYERHGFSFDGRTKTDPPYGLERRMVR